MATRGARKARGCSSHLLLEKNPEEIVLVTMYAKNVTDNVEPTVLKRIRNAYESD